MLRNSRPMSTRLAATSAAIVLAGGLTACSGSDDDPVSNPRGDADSAQSDGQDGAGDKESAEPIVGDQSLKCTAKVDVTGAVKLSWKQPGEAIVKSSNSEGDGPLAFYTSTNPNGKTMVLLYSEGPGFKPSVTLSSNKTNFSTGTSGAKGLTAAEDGSKVTAENVTVTGIGGKTKAQVSATFTCGEKVGQKKNKKKN